MMSSRQDSMRMVCGLVMAVRYLQGDMLSHAWVNHLSPDEPQLELIDYLRGILDRHAMSDERLADPHCTYAVIEVRNRMGLGYAEAIKVVGKRRLPVLQEWWPHGSRRIAPKPSGEAD